MAAFLFAVNQQIGGIFILRNLIIATKIDFESVSVKINQDFPIFLSTLALGKIILHPISWTIFKLILL